jgi:hypothetical protein
MADSIDWKAEYIPGDADTYMRAHRTYFRGPKLLPGVFKSRDGGMSVDWEKYSTPEETRQRSTSNPLDNAIISLPVVGVRGIRNLDVKHTPDHESANRAHSDVLGIPDGGEDLTEIRVSLLDISRVVISL